MKALSREGGHDKVALFRPVVRADVDNVGSDTEKRRRRSQGFDQCPVPLTGVEFTRALLVPKWTVFKDTACRPLNDNCVQLLFRRLWALTWMAWGPETERLVRSVEASGAEVVTCPTVFTVCLRNSLGGVA